VGGAGCGGDGSRDTTPARLEREGLANTLWREVVSACRVCWFQGGIEGCCQNRHPHTSVNNALGVFSQQDRAKQVEEKATVVLLTASNYKVSASVGSGDQMTSTACCVLDTGSGLNLIRKSCVPAGVQQQTIPKGLLTIVAANKSRAPVDGMVRMVVKIGDVAQVETMLVTEHLPVDLILGTSWIDQHVEAIWPQRRVVTLVTGTCVAIECRDATKKPIRLAEPVVVPPMAEASIRVRCDWRGLALVESRQSG
jgi:hypothetical protein